MPIIAQNYKTASRLRICVCVHVTGTLLSISVERHCRGSEERQTRLYQTVEQGANICSNLYVVHTIKIEVDYVDVNPFQSSSSSGMIDEATYDVVISK